MNVTDLSRGSVGSVGFAPVRWKILGILSLLGFLSYLFRNAYIAEQSTSLKLGLYLPGKHIPIVDEEIIFREQPDYALMLSWHYWKPIVTKLREKGLKSKIVIPLPELHILDF